jgi:hypothetical protein
MKRKKPMRNTTINVGPLLVTLAVVFTTYFGAALAMPAMPAGIQAGLVSIPTCLLSMKGMPNENHRAGVTLARVTRNG